MPPATQQSAQGLYFGSAPVAAMRGPLHRWLPGLLGLLSGLLGLLCAEPRAADAQQCRLCENGTYCFDETLFVCPANSRSQPGSGNITACVCIAGHYATADHVCRPCEPGWFCPGDESLRACPGNSSSDVFAVDMSDCFCSPGYTGMLGPSVQECAACTSGSAKAGNGSAACVLCAPGTFQAAPAAAACNQCPAHSSTPGVTGARHGSTAATACVSDPGYFSNGSTGRITVYAAGTFQPLANQTACTDCRRGDPENRFYTLENASTSAVACLTCPDHSGVLGAASGHGIRSCACSVGFTGADGGSCVACAVGLVKAIAGSARCVACAADEYANPMNTMCLACTGNSSSAAASDNRSACVCAAGFALNPAAPFDCQECAAGPAV